VYFFHALYKQARSTGVLLHAILAVRNYHAQA
jgi:hypothetical protein